MPCCEVYDFAATLYAQDSGKAYTFEVSSLVNLEIKHTISLTQEGFIVIEDLYDISSLINANKNLWLHILVVENSQKNHLHYSFKVINSTKSGSENKSLIRFDLIDSLSYVLSKSYKPSYQLTLSSCLKDCISEFYDNDKDWKEPGLSGIKNFRIKYDFDIKTDNSKEFNIPSGKNFLDSFNNELNNQGYICYQESGNIRFSSISNIKLLQLSLETPVYKRYGYDFANSPQYLYFSKFSEKPKILNAPKTTNYSVDYASKKLKIQTQNLGDIGVSENPNAQDSQGQNLEYTETSNPERLAKTTYFDFLDNYIGYIVVPARKSNIILLNEVKVESHNPGENTKTKDTGDIKHSGKFVVTGYTHKMVNRNRWVTLAKIARFDNPNS